MSLTLCDTSTICFPPAQAGRDTGTACTRTTLLRRYLWSAVVQALDDSGVPYCILGAPDEAPDPTESDLDFAVRPVDYRFVPQLLAGAASSAGGLLVQAIQHETTATYFAIARQEGEEVAFVNPDCTTDYRREGRFWLSAEELLGGRTRTAAGFFRPSPDVDFKYYFIKQVLKWTLTHAQWKKLTALYRSAGHPEHAFSLWPPGTRDEIVRALGQSKPAVFRNLLPRLSLELRRTPYREGMFGRAHSSFDELLRLGRRVLQPTGLFVRTENAGNNERALLAHHLSHAVAPAFRRTQIVHRYSAARTVRGLMYSTLVISTEETGAVYGGPRVRWRHELTPAENLQSAIATVVSHMSQRTMRRLRLQEAGERFVRPAEVRAS